LESASVRWTMTHAVGVSACGRIRVRRSMFGVRRSAFTSALICWVTLLAPFSILVAKQTFSGSDGASIAFSRDDANLIINYRSPSNAEHTVFVAIGSHTDIGSAVIPFSES